MLDSVKIQRRQSEIRQALAELVGRETPTEDETRSMTDLDAEYRVNETRYRAALISEDQERREAGEELETRDGREWADMMAGFEMRQIARALDEGRALSGQTAEIVTEMRERGGYRGMPVPFEALEQRNTVAGSVPDPIRTMPTIDRIFAQAAATRMGARMINIDSGEVEYPVTSSSVTAGWSSTEAGDVTGPTQYTVTDRPLVPQHNLGITMHVSRRALKQAGTALEQAIRRDMLGTIQEEMDKAIFLGTGSSGEPAGVVDQASGYSITETSVAATATWAAFRAAVVRFMDANAISSPGEVNLLIRPSVYEELDETVFDAGSGMTEWDRLTKNISNVVTSANALAAATGSPLASKALLTCSPGGVAPIYVGMWGGVDVIRDPFTDAASGGLRLTGLLTADVTISRAAQLEVLTGVQED